MNRINWVFAPFLLFRFLCSIIVPSLKIGNNGSWLLKFVVILAILQLYTSLLNRVSRLVNLFYRLHG